MDSRQQTWEAKVTNAGPGGMAGLRIIDELPDGFVNPVLDAITINGVDASAQFTTAVVGDDFHITAANGVIITPSDEVDLTISAAVDPGVACSALDPHILRARFGVTASIAPTLLLRSATRREVHDST